MASTTMAAGSQPASMPAESNLDPVIQLTSPVRSAIFEIDPSWADRALAAGSEGTSPQHGVPEGTALCANPHTPVSGSPLELSQVPTVEQAAAAGRAAKNAARAARRKQQRAEKRRELKALAEASIILQMGDYAIYAACVAHHCGLFVSG